jgi:hypothetical protein
MASGRDVFAAVRGVAWDGPDRDPAGVGPDGRNAVPINVIADARGKIGTVDTQMIYQA